jgi:hypothetical protein
MSWKMFGQIALLMLIGVLILMLMKCAMFKCPIMGKYGKACSHSMCVPK